MRQQLNNMIVLCANKFDGIFDKGGHPYILHCMEVMHNVVEMFGNDDIDLLCIALGHDLIEDTDVIDCELVHRGFSSRVIAGIAAMSKVDGESYQEYKAKVFSNTDACKVKMCDIKHNMCLNRLKGVDEKDLIRMNRYTVFYHELGQLIH